MESATHFIDYFVHDILDYTILNKKDQNFTPNEQVFDIKQAVKHIIDIQEDKAKMKNIRIDTMFEGCA